MKHDVLAKQCYKSKPHKEEPLFSLWF